MKTITLITPIYHGEKYIPKLLENAEQSAALFLEHYPEAEIEYVLVNDSPEQPIVIEKPYHYFRLIIVENEKNSGIHFSRVNGLIHSTGKFIQFLDQDDKLRKDSLLNQYEKIGKADVITANGYRITKNQKKKIYGSKLALNMTMYYSFYLWGTDMILSPGQCLIRRNAIPEKWYENILDINGCDDFYLWILMFHNKARFTVNPGCLYSHMEIETNYSGDYSKMDQSYLEMCRLLEQDNLISLKELEILRKRIKLRREWKKQDVIGKIKLWFSNVRILTTTFLYKLAGYQ